MDNPKSFINKYTTLILAIVVLFVTTVLLQVNYNKNHISNYSVDEYFTISTIHPKFTPENTVHRALNGPRIFTYIFYPGALIGMIGHMGGNLQVEGWDYPGYNYFVKNYQTTTKGLAENMKDPNLRYFHYYLKLQSILFMFITFLPLIYYLWRNNYLIAMFMLSGLVGINFLFLEQRSVFYIEPLLLSMINLLLWYYLYLRERFIPQWFMIVVAGFLFSLTLSLKFSCIFLIVLICIQIAVKYPRLESRLKALTLLLFSFLFFFCLFNWYLFVGKEVFGAIIHDYFSNFWQYATGNKGLANENFIRFNLKNITTELIPSLGGLLLFLPLIVFLGLRWGSARERFTWGSLLFVLLITIWGIAKQRVYYDRNILPFIPLLVLLCGIFLDIIYRQAKTSTWYSKQHSQKITIGIFILVLFLPMLVLSESFLNKAVPDVKTNFIQELQTVKRPEYKRLIAISMEIDTTELAFQDYLALSSFPETNGYNLTEELNRLYETLRPEDVVAVAETGNNKQLTTYGLPKIFNTNRQYGKYFFFFNSAGENQQLSEYENALEEDAAIVQLSGSYRIREDLALRKAVTVPYNGAFRIYFNFRFYGKDIEDLYGCRMYFHAYPLLSMIKSLPSDRIPHGFENFAFTFNKNNTFKYGTEVIVYQDFTPSVKEYHKFVFGIFRGCGKSEPFQIDNVSLQPLD